MRSSKPSRSLRRRYTDGFESREHDGRPFSEHLVVFPSLLQRPRHRVNVFSSSSEVGEIDTVKPMNAVFLPIARINLGSGINLNQEAVYDTSPALRRSGVTNGDSACPAPLEM